MSAQLRTRSRPGARSRSSRARAVAIIAIATTILLWGAAWIALGIALVQDAGA